MKAHNFTRRNEQSLKLFHFSPASNMHILPSCISIDGYMRNGMVPVGNIPSCSLSCILSHLFLLQFNLFMNHPKSTIFNRYVNIQYCVFRGINRSDRSTAYDSVALRKSKPG